MSVWTDLGQTGLTFLCPFSSFDGIDLYYAYLFPVPAPFWPFSQLQLFTFLATHSVFTGFAIFGRYPFSPASPPDPVFRP